MKKGFTLIELLAVIVILAIIAVIAVPIVLNIIEDTKENASLRSADFYLDAVEMGVAQATLKNKNIEDKTYDIMSDGNICLETLTAGKCMGTGNRENNEEDILKVEVNGEAPTSGKISITNGNITGLNIILNEKEIYKTSKGELVYVKTLDEVCELVSGTPKIAGSKYECKVDPNKEPYTFYVLTTPNKDDERINLIMDSNINISGEAVKEGKTDLGLVAWSISDYEEVYEFQPIIAIDYLKTATSGWTNTNELTINKYTICSDEGNCFDKSMAEYVVNARMPYYSEMNSYDETTGAYAYLYDYLSDGGYQTNVVSNVWGYWTLSSYNQYPNYAWYIDSYGIPYYDSCQVWDNDYNGVRPVISLKI